MSQANFRFYGELNFFLPTRRRHITFTHQLAPDSSIKDTIEAIGVPHPEIDVILVNGQGVDFSYQAQPEDDVKIYPLFWGLEPPTIRVGPPQLGEARFILDTHLGRLASHLRILGFNTLYRNDYEDSKLAEISSEESRILLTRDLGVLKRSIVTYGYYVREVNPEKQVIELLRRYKLIGQIQPFLRCTHCNGLLQEVDKEKIIHRLRPNTRLEYNKFRLCSSCQKIYWRGSHVEHIEEWIERICRIVKDEYNDGSPHQ